MKAQRPKIFVFCQITFQDAPNEQINFFFVSGSGHLEVVEFLLQNNQCDVNAMTRSQYTPLHEAVFKKHLEIVKVLIKKKANVNAGALGELTPLHEAAKAGKSAICFVFKKMILFQIRFHVKSKQIDFT